MYDSSFVDNDDRINRRFDDGAQAGFARAQRVLGMFALRDVDQGENDAGRIGADLVGKDTQQESAILDRDFMLAGRTAIEHRLDLFD